MKVTTFSYAPRTSYGAILHLTLSVHELELLARLISTMDPQDNADREIIAALQTIVITGHRAAKEAIEADHKAGINPNQERSW